MVSNFDNAHFTFLFDLLTSSQCDRMQWVSHYAYFHFGSSNWYAHCHVAVITTQQTWWHHDHDGVRFCETDSIIRTTSIDTVTPPSRKRFPIESRSWPLNPDCIPPVSSIIFPMERCDSPTPVWECEGDCRKYYVPTADAAHVVCADLDFILLFFFQFFGRFFCKDLRIGLWGCSTSMGRAWRRVDNDGGYSPALRPTMIDMLSLSGIN